jgi:hypothetical protein
VVRVKGQLASIDVYGDALRRRRAGDVPQGCQVPKIDSDVCLAPRRRWIERHFPPDLINRDAQPRGWARNGIQLCATAASDRRERSLHRRLGVEGHLASQHIDCCASGVGRTRDIVQHYAAAPIDPRGSMPLWRDQAEGDLDASVSTRDASRDRYTGHGADGAATELDDQGRAPLLGVEHDRITVAGHNDTSRHRRTRNAS